MQHARNRPVINGFVRIHRLGVILLNDVVNLRELMQALAYTGVAVVGGRRVLLGKQHTQKTAGCQKQNDKNGSSMRTTGHLQVPSAQASEPPRHGDFVQYNTRKNKSLEVSRHRRSPASHLLFLDAGSRGNDALLWRVRKLLQSGSISTGASFEGLSLIKAVL